MRIAIGCDHRGIEVKQSVIRLLEQAGYCHEDFGARSADAVDYPDIALGVACAVALGDCERGILICDTGIGMSIAANKVRGVRAALCHDAFSAGRARLHNDANVLCLAARNGVELAAEIVRAFLLTQFEGGRHQRRVDKIGEIEGQLSPSMQSHGV
ncbi:MAG: ribose 5-phosphate isomerase B [Chloroflexi bacterium]|nr:ribose 5-phosphate isomerase B [Chloroflexota bacterium]